MKNILILISNICCFALGLAFIFSLLNYFFHLHLGMKGSEVPDDPRAALLILAFAAAFGGLSYLLQRKRAK
jgi:hypothetical protein